MAQPLNATFFAFRKREKGGVLLGASIAYLVVAVALIAIFVVLNLSSLAGVAGWYGQLMSDMSAGVPPNSVPPPAFAGLVGAYFLFLFAIFILLAAYEAACLRWMIRGETEGFLGLSLGADTWRVYAGYWIWLFIFIAFYILFAVVMMASGVGFAAAVSSDGSNAGAGLLVMVVLSLGVLAAWTFVAVRLSPGAAASVAMKRFAMFDAWRMTSGRFWPLFGAFFLLFVLYIVAILIVEVVGAMVMGATMFAAMAGRGSNTDPSAAMSALFTPAMIIPIMLLYVGILAIAMTFYVAMFGVNARAVLAAADEGKAPGFAPQAETFS